MAAVLLRRTFTGQWEESWEVLSDDMKKELKNSLIQLMQGVCNENVSSLVRKRVSDCVAELCRRLVEEDGDQNGNGSHPWEEILHFVFQLAQSNTNIGLETVLNLVYQCPNIFGNRIGNYTDHLFQLMSKFYKDTLTSGKLFKSTLEP